MRFTRTARLSTPDLDTPWRAAEFCVLDLETTGLNLHRDGFWSPTRPGSSGASWTGCYAGAASGSAPW